MTRNFVLCFLQNLTTSKKQHLEALTADNKISSDKLLFGETSNKSKLSCNILMDEKVFDTTSMIDDRSKTKSIFKPKSFYNKIRKSR